MTLLGKCFSVVILILSLTFMVLALAVNASHRNWRDVVLGDNGLKAQIETIERTNTQLLDSKNRTQEALDRELAARRTAIAALQTSFDQLESVLQASEQTVTQLEAKTTELSQLDKSRALELQRLTEETGRLRQQIRKEQADRDNLFAKTLELTDSANKLRGVVQLQKERNTQLLSQVTRFKEVVDANGIDVNRPLDGAPPQRNGNILVVDRPKELVELSIGSDDGLRNGHMLEVTRKNRYVGKLEVISTEPDRSVARIMRDYSEGILLEGDRVDTTLE